MASRNRIGGLYAPRHRTPSMKLFQALVAAAILSIFTVFFSFPAMAQDNPPNQISSINGDIRIEQLATLEYPWGLAFLPDGRLLITEKPGRLRLWDEQGLSEPLPGLPEIIYVRDGEQGGLLDVAVDPDFRNNQLIYISYVEAAQQQADEMSETGDARFGSGLDMTDNVLRGGVVARAQLTDNGLQDLQVIWRQFPKTVGRGHFGNRLLFSADDKLFISSGDRMRFDPAQSLKSNLGKIVRINPDGTIPDDNPFADDDDLRGDVWSYGHRNILAMAAEPESDRLWAVEMGPLGGDELNLVMPGVNYGWPTVSNGDHYNGATIEGHLSHEEMKAPLRSWTPVISPSGALFYDSTLFKDWQGDLLVGGLSSKSLVRLRILDGSQIVLEERIPLQRRVRDLAQAPDGSLLLIEDDAEGALLRLSPARR